MTNMTSLTVLHIANCQLLIAFPCVQRKAYSVQLFISRLTASLLAANSVQLIQHSSFKIQHK
jgi:hypothetical protein